MIVTDSNADFVPGYAAEKGIIEVELTYLLGGASYRCNDPAVSRAEFYQRMRAGEMPKTSAVNVADTKSLLTPALQEGNDLLCIMFSSALSGTFQNTCLAAEELRLSFPEREIIVIDSLCASAGEGLLVSRAVNYRGLGLTLQEAASRIQADIPHIAHLFTVDDLFHLQRGGRVSKAAAVIGSMLGIKPTLHVDEEGRLVPTGKVRGRRQALLALADNMERQMDTGRCDCFAISHGDCLDDAEFLADEIQRRFGISRHTISYVGPTIGAHSGPGTVALFFYASVR